MPIGSFGGALRSVRERPGRRRYPQAIARANVAPEPRRCDHGLRSSGGAGMNVARQAALKAGVPVDVPAETVNRVCGSDCRRWLRAVAVAAGSTPYRRRTESMSNRISAEGARWGSAWATPKRPTRCWPRTHVRDQLVPHGAHRRGNRFPLPHPEGRTGRIRRGEPASRGPGTARRDVRG